MAYHYLWPDLWPEVQMVHIIANWLVSALALWLVAQIVPGIELRDFGAALLGTLVIAIVNGTLGWVLRLVTLPLTLVTLGLFLLVLNALLLKLASLFTPGFRIHGFLSAVLGSLVLTVLSYLLRHLVFSGGARWTTL
jgi:putative membrane protein